MAHRVSIGLISAAKARTALLMCALYLVLHWLQVHAVGPEWLRHYGKDVLLVPLLLLATEITAQLLGRPMPIRLREVLLCLVYVSVAFELVLPHTGHAAPGDWRDVGAYSIGGMLYCLLFSRKGG